MIDIAQAQQEYVVGLRRAFHQNPELRWGEEKTIQTIADELEDIIDMQTIGYAVIDTCGDYTGGIAIDLNFDPSFDRILFRSDIDALPIQEKTGLDFVSQVPGVMHACGHDVHPAILLGALRAIVQNKLKPKRNLRFVFQRAEENPGSEPNPKSGGKTLVEEKVLEGVSHAFALHIWAAGEPGVFYSRPGAFLGNSDRWRIKITSTGGHVARPHAGTNALRVMHAIQTMLNENVQRPHGPFVPISLEPTILKAGTATNVMPSEAELWYGVRTLFDQQKRVEFFDFLEHRVRTYLESVPGTTVEFQRVFGHPALFNSESNYKGIEMVLAQAGEKLQEHEPILGGEDFAYYLQQVPGCIVMLGAKQEGSGDHHSPTFNPDESVFWKGVLFWLILACS